MLDANSIVIILIAAIMAAILAVAGYRHLVPMIRAVAQSSEPASMAKLLVTAIKLEHPDILEEARKECHIYPALKDEILRARDIYFDHIRSKGLISEELSAGHFEQALVEILADGDRSVLGLHGSLEEEPLN